MAAIPERSCQVRVPARVDFAGGWSDVHHFSAREGGAVLNAAIDTAVEGRASWDGRRLHLEYTLELPPGSHLGTSSAIDVAWLRLTFALMGKRVEGAQLAETAYRLEKLLGLEGGKQDQYAAALGGFQVLRFGPEDEPAQVERLDVRDEVVRALAARCVLAYLPPEGAADATHQRVWERFGRGDEAIAATLRELRDSVEPARDALLAGDLERLAELLTRNRELARRLQGGAVTPAMDAVFAAGERAGALGGKPCGAGGGGCLLLLAGEGRQEAVAAAAAATGARVIPFRFAPDTA